MVRKADAIPNGMVATNATGPSSRLCLNSVNNPQKNAYAAKAKLITTIAVSINPHQLVQQKHNARLFGYYESVASILVRPHALVMPFAHS